jgi:hypothetical protein
MTEINGGEKTIFAICIKRKCGNCGKEEKSIKAEGTDLKRCAGCNIMFYCSSDCQRANWTEHRKVCKNTRLTESQYKQYKKMRRNEAQIPKKLARKRENCSDKPSKMVCSVGGAGTDRSDELILKICSTAKECKEKIVMFRSVSNRGESNPLEDCVLITEKNYPADYLGGRQIVEMLRKKGRLTHNKYNKKRIFIMNYDTKEEFKYMIRVYNTSKGFHCEYIPAFRFKKETQE